MGEHSASFFENKREENGCCIFSMMHLTHHVEPTERLEGKARFELALFARDCARSTKRARKMQAALTGTTHRAYLAGGNEGRLALAPRGSAVNVSGLPGSPGASQADILLYNTI